MDERGLACAHLTNDAYELALLDLHVHLLQVDNAFEGLRLRLLSKLVLHRVLRRLHSHFSGRRDGRDGLVFRLFGLHDALLHVLFFFGLVF